MLQESFYNAEAIERARARLSRAGLDADAERARRFTEAETARRIRPYFAVARLSTLPDAGSGAGVLPNAAPVNLLVPGAGGFPRRTAIYGAMTDAQRSTALFNIMRRRNLPSDVYEQGMLSSPQRAAYLAGDTLHGALRIGPARWNVWPEAEIFEKGEPLNLLGVGDGADSNVSNCYFTFYGEQEYDPNSTEGGFDAGEASDVASQIRRFDEQSTGTVTLNVDYANPATYTEVQLPILERWSVLLGFASATATASAAFLRWSTVDIQDHRGQKWSNEPIPIGALCSYPFDSGNTHVWYRKLLTPYLLAPGDYKRLILTFAKRALTGGGDYPANVAVDTVGKLAAVVKLV